MALDYVKWGEKVKGYEVMDRRQDVMIKSLLGIHIRTYTSMKPNELNKVREIISWHIR